MMLLITGMGYFLVSKTLQSYELNKELLAKQELENTFLQEQVTHQQEELASANEKLELATYLDSLTGLWNRVYWNIYYNDLISANPDVRLVLFSLDINFFKMINDTYGHAVGDKLLREFGKRIATFQTDDIRGFRIGGDQFMISCVDVDHGFNVVRFSDRLLETLSKPYIFDDKEIHVAANIGGAIYPDDTDDIEKLMNYAEFARNTLKHTSNVSSCIYYKDNFMPKLQRKFMIEQKLQEINYDTDLLLYYQPQVVTTTGEVIGIEALVRWKDPEWGILSPLEFIPVAEEMGIMSEMGEWISTQAMRQISIWNQAYNTDLMMGINVSPVQFQDEFFVETFLDLISASGVKPEWIDIEVTEGIALNRNAKNEDLIERLRENHVSVSVDDFGTGYASFHNMLSFHFDRIKIARDLIEELSESEDARVVVEAIVRMAKGMGLTAVAEGVETQEELDLLIGLGCEQCQGFFFGRPMPAADFEEYWLRQED
jgi:diguanylate cyclase (GGDEF)-like protein